MRELSSRLTFFYKFALPLLWLGGFAIGTRQVLFAPPYFDAQWWQFFSFWLAVTVFMVFTTGFAKAVSWETKTGRLTISNFLRSETISVDQVEAIDGTTLLSPRLVWLILKEPCSFGKKIVFLPVHRQAGAIGKSPLVGELRKEFKLT